MMKVKSWPRLIISIIISQSAGLIGSAFTFSAIPTWYAFLNKPSFSPPNWLFGPVWTILYTLIGISFYRMWMKHNKKTFWTMKFFIFHLILNSLWSILFFGMKNLGLAFAEIIVMWSTIVIMIITFSKIDKLASYLLIPYLLWVSFASILNFAVWRLNPQNTVKDVFAEDFTFKKAQDDYIFSSDVYNQDLNDFNLKRDSYRKNQTLSLKEELRLSLYKFIGTRDTQIKNYLTMVRMKILESDGIDKNTKESLYTKIDPEVTWFGSRIANNYNKSDNLEDLVNKSKEEDSRFKTDTTPVIYLALAQISLGEVRSIKAEHIKIYSDLKSESENLTKLGRADPVLFDRWFKDIDQELNDISTVETKTQSEIDKIFGGDDYQRSSAYKNALKQLDPAKEDLLKLNGFISELEDIISNKR